MREITLISIVCVNAAEHLSRGILEWVFLKIREQNCPFLKGNSNHYSYLLM